MRSAENSETCYVGGDHDAFEIKKGKSSQLNGRTLIPRWCVASPLLLKPTNHHSTRRIPFLLLLFYIILSLSLSLFCISISPATLRSDCCIRPSILAFTTLAHLGPPRLVSPLTPFLEQAKIVDRSSTFRSDYHAHTLHLAVDADLLGLFLFALSILSNTHNNTRWYGATCFLSFTLLPSPPRVRAPRETLVLSLDRRAPYQVVTSRLLHLLCRPNIQGSTNFLFINTKHSLCLVPTLVVSRRSC